MQIGKKAKKGAGKRVPGWRKAGAGKKPKRPSTRAVSFAEFKLVRENFYMLFSPNLGRVISPNIYRAALREAGYSFTKLRKELPEDVAAVEQIIVDYNAAKRAVATKYGLKKVHEGYVVLQVIRLPEPKRSKALADLTRLRAEFLSSSARPLYALYLLLRKKGLSNKALGLDWQKVFPKPRK